MRLNFFIFLSFLFILHSFLKIYLYTGIYFICLLAKPARHESHYVYTKQTCILCFRMKKLLNKGGVRVKHYFKKILYFIQYNFTLFKYIKKCIKLSKLYVFCHLLINTLYSVPLLPYCNLIC